MTTFQDLEPLGYFGKDAAAVLVAIGWLGPTSEFTRGTVSPPFFRKLRELVANRFEPVMFMGLHECELCQFDGPAAGGNLFVPAGACLFVCPELVVHYVATHRYEPPQEFQQAVLCCPDPKSRAYRQAFVAAGGRVLLDGG